MGKIIAIGGGEIGRPGHRVETTIIDREIIRLSGKEHPRLLFIPTASGDAEVYIETMHKHFGKRLGCKVESLCLIIEKPTADEIFERILNSDIVYVGGGNTMKMMRTWRRLGVDKALKEAYKKDIVLSGVSAGSICWFRGGESDSKKNERSQFKHMKVSGLGFINALHCPHYDVEKERKTSLKSIMKKDCGVAIALENCCAIEVVGSQYRIITSNRGKKAYKVFWSNGLYHENAINEEKSFSSLANLLKKE